MRRPLIAGNWKMNGNKELASGLMTGLKQESLKTDVEIVVCCPFTLLSLGEDLCRESNLKLGAQNLHWEEKGAFTGEISAQMLLEHNVEYVIIGHSERREYFNETDEIVNKKVIKAIESGLKPILCVGETLGEKDAGKTNSKVSEQVLKALKGVDNLNSITIAYEPIWAIGTGKTPTPQEANEVISYIRNTISKDLGEEVSEEIRILYGGSVNGSNASEFLNEEDIDGALVGGASLKVDEFIEIVNF